VSLWRLKSSNADPTAVRFRPSPGSYFLFCASHVSLKALAEDWKDFLEGWMLVGYVQYWAWRVGHRAELFDFEEQFCWITMLIDEYIY
jgi:hypothetical protein